MSNNTHIGSSLDDFLSEEGILQIITDNLQGETMSKSDGKKVQKEVDAELQRKQLAEEKGNTKRMLDPDKENALLNIIKQTGNR